MIQRGFRVLPHQSINQSNLNKKMKILNIFKKIITLDTSSIDNYFVRDDNIVDVTIRRIDNFLYHRDTYFWFDSESIEECEHAFVDSPDDKRDRIHLFLLRGLVSSYLPDDVQFGLTMLQDLLLHAPTPKQKRKVMFILALGYFRIGNFSKSLDSVSRCLEIKP
uniref:mitochondrial fission 1 protein B-like n=1 Tax=Erigeron canadensis TaxID=72917 RepID=UPI001CB89B75|nr:mitochondrial fission 1 protein B-like [Erigeron canadensis]